MSARKEHCRITKEPKETTVVISSFYLCKNLSTNSGQQEGLPSESQQQRLHDPRSHVPSPSRTTPGTSLSRSETRLLRPCHRFSPCFRWRTLPVCAMVLLEFNACRAANSSFSSSLFCIDRLVTSPAKFLSSTAAADANSFAYEVSSNNFWFCTRNALLSSTL
uniref:Uncharacterized protein n=1 Tax=Solanum lycopersicum TaxID=4081 RepID=A0A3Q7ETY9_SOLLC